MCNLSIYMAFKVSIKPAGYTSTVSSLKWAWSLTVDHASYMLSAELHNNHNHIVIGVYYKAKVQLLLQLQSRL